MMKCDMCYDRTSVGLQADVRHGLPEPGAGLRHARGDRAAAAALASRSTRFQFGQQTIRTKVNMMVPRDAAADIVDVTAAMHEPTIGHDMLDDVFAEISDGGDA